MMNAKSFVVLALGAAMFNACGAAKTATDDFNSVKSAVNSAANQSLSSQPQSAQVAPSAAVTARAAEIRMRAGIEVSAAAEIEVLVADGYHINANPASYSYLRPTVLTIEPTNAVKAGKPVYPAGEMVKFAFADKPISVYAGTVKIKLPLQIAAAARAGETVLKTAVEAQPCNETACFPSRTVAVSIPLVIEK